LIDIEWVIEDLTKNEGPAKLAGRGVSPLKRSATRLLQCPRVVYWNSLTATLRLTFHFFVRFFLPYDFFCIIFDAAIMESTIC
jgi:hypothetical protein